MNEKIFITCEQILKENLRRYSEFSHIAFRVLFLSAHTRCTVGHFLPAGSSICAVWVAFSSLVPVALFLWTCYWMDKTQIRSIQTKVVPSRQLASKSRKRTLPDPRSLSLESALFWLLLWVKFNLFLGYIWMQSHRSSFLCLPWLNIMSSCVSRLIEVEVVTILLFLWMNISCLSILSVDIWVLWACCMAGDLFYDPKNVGHFEVEIKEKGVNLKEKQ